MKGGGASALSDVEVQHRSVVAGDKVKREQGKNGLRQDGCGEAAGRNVFPSHEMCSGNVAVTQ